ncbi:hypothetical protein THAOC_31010 [Thalassiosira oceanica]|uniref:RxLR effector protein n=1 Tax=Thalassiosira oceanica TaxID=159749 RepID=K0RCR4_THAOC|nr:hypothetical protein THAOC_31010 [Thalassiosira oceanica]|eukprot:EJK50059.1 hypothetical protein THAOC_31010 [Thalassiosira oceanica]
MKLVMASIALLCASVNRGAVVSPLDVRLLGVASVAEEHMRAYASSAQGHKESSSVPMSFPDETRDSELRDRRR